MRTALVWLITYCEVRIQGNILFQRISGRRP